MCKDDEAQLVLFTSLDIIECVPFNHLIKFNKSDCFQRYKTHCEVSGIGYCCLCTHIIHLATGSTRAILPRFPPNKTTFYSFADSNSRRD